MGWRGIKFPDEPPQVNPDNPYEDPNALVELREWALRRKFIDMEKAKIIREKLKHCYVTEGVNHHYRCRELVEKYLDSIKNIGVHLANAGPHDLGRAEARAKLIEGT